MVESCSNEMVEREMEMLKFLLSIFGISLYHTLKNKKRDRGREVKGYESLIGNTSLIKLNSLSKLVGCEIFVKV